MLIGINILGFVVSFFQANWQRDAHGRMHCYSAVNAQLSLQDPQGATVASSPIYPCRHSNMPQVFRLDAVWWVRGINLFYDLNNVDLYKPRFMPATSSACGWSAELRRKQMTASDFTWLIERFFANNSAQILSCCSIFQTFRSRNWKSPTKSAFSPTHNNYSLILGSCTPLHLKLDHLPAQYAQQRCTSSPSNLVAIIQTLFSEDGLHCSPSDLQSNTVAAQEQVNTYVFYTTDPLTYLHCTTCICCFILLKQMSERKSYPHFVNCAACVCHGASAAALRYSSFA